MKKNFKRHIPSGAIIFNNKGEVLLCKRISKSSKWHDKWEFPGGTIEFGEDPKETAIRETLEEVGINIKLITDFPIIMNYADEKNDEDYICISFPALYINGKLDVSKDKSVSDARWFKHSDIKFDNCLPFTKEMLEIAVRFI